MPATVVARARTAPTRTTRKTGQLTYNVKGTATATDSDDILQLIQRGELTQSVPDAFKDHYISGDPSGINDLRIMTPPVNLSALMRMPNDNSILRQCLEAMVINTEGHGWRLEYIGEDGKEKSEEAQTEKKHIEEYLEGLHPELSLVELRKRIRWDIEIFGFAFIELLRDREGLPVGLTHIPAHTMRVTTVDTAAVPIKTETNRFGRKSLSTATRRFRRYVQLVGARKVWFKEAGDPRNISPVTGKVEDSLPYEDTATEVIMLKQYAAGQVYGMPRWLNNNVAIQGSRQAELTNLDYFKENAIPALAVLVAGGFLHGETITHIEEHVTAARGRSSQNRVLVIEVEGDPRTASKDGVIPAPQVTLQPLSGERPNEGQFLEYDKAQIEKVRSSFRLPPIFTGHAQDYSHASAKTSYEVAEGQVFGPERGVLDDTINRQMLKPYDVKYWSLRSNPPRISDPDEVMAAVETFDKVGAMTPNIAIGLANEQFGLDIPVITEKWGDFPFALVTQLATQGKLEGLDEITKEIDSATDPLTGLPVVGPNANPATDPNVPNTPDTPVEEKVAKVMRRGLSEVVALMDVQREAKFAPRKRVRVAAK